MLRVFVSYRQSDGRPAADAVVAALSEDGHEVFRDSDVQRGLKAGDELVAELHQRIVWADVVVVIVSPELAGSTWCFAELTLARTMGKRVIPVRTVADARHPLIADTVLAMSLGELDRLRRELAEWDPGGPRRWDWTRGTPFPGLRGFVEGDEAAFFGRDADVGKLRERLQRANTSRRLTCLAGASGSGKSSLLRAGLLPALRRDVGWRLAPVVTIDGGSPIEAARVALEEVGAELGVEDWPEAPKRLREALRKTPQQHILLCFDQFEQIHVAVSEKERERLWEGLLALATAPLTRVHVMLTTRIDYVDRLLELGAVQDDIVLLEPLRGARMRSVITGPARAAGLSVEDELVDRLVADASGADGLPLLAALLNEMTAGLREGQRIDAARYQGVTGVLDRLAHEASQQLADVGREKILAALLRLVSVDEHGMVVRRRVPEAEIDGDVKAIYAAFVERRLLVKDRDTYDVAHEALFRAWEPLAEAIRGASEDLRLETELVAVAHRWVESGRPHDDYLWGGSRLERADAWLKAHPDASESVQAFVHLSRRQDVTASRALASNVALRVETELSGRHAAALRVLLAAHERHGWSPQLVRVMRAFVEEARLIAVVQPAGYLSREALSVDLDPQGHRVAAVFLAHKLPPGKLHKRSYVGEQWPVAGVYDLRTSEWLWLRKAEGVSRIRLLPAERIAMVCNEALLVADAATGLEERQVALHGPILDLRVEPRVDVAVAWTPGNLIKLSAGTMVEVARLPGPARGKRIWLTPDASAAVSCDFERAESWALSSDGPPGAAHVSAQVQDSARPLALLGADEVSAQFTLLGRGTVVGDQKQSLDLGTLPAEVSLDAQRKLLAVTAMSSVSLYDRSSRSPRVLAREEGVALGTVPLTGQEAGSALPWLRFHGLRPTTGTAASAGWPSRSGRAWATGRGPVQVHTASGSE